MASAVELSVDPKLSQKPTEAWERLQVKQTIEQLSPMDHSTPPPENTVRFVCLSDTHNVIEAWPDLIPQGDVLLHAGDFTKIGYAGQVDKFNTFLGTLPHKVKVVIAGNHDMTLDDYSMTNRREELEQFFRLSTTKCEKYLQERNLKSCRELMTNCVYLHDSSVDICGIKIYGSPWVPQFCNMGFNVDRGQPILDKWNLIPSNTDILMTHGPPLGQGDLCFHGLRAGCLELLNTVQKRVKPKYHIFGHIHEGYGLTFDGTTTFINASTCCLRYQPSNPPVVFDLPLPSGHSKEELCDTLVTVSAEEQSS